jgi:HlyD family type I secretion membrane fusion protein
MLKEKQKPAKTTKRKAQGGPATNDYSYKLFGLFVVVVMLGGFFSWAAFAPLQSAVVATGQVTAESRNKVVQHLEGGVIEKLLVREGDSVQQGQLLIQLSDIQARSQYQLSQTQLYRALANKDRINAERQAQTQINWSEHTLELSHLPEMQQWMQSQQDLMQRRLATHQTSIQVRHDQIAQAQAQINGFKRIEASLERQIDLLKQDIEDLQRLFNRNFIDKQRIREQEQQLEGYITQQVTYQTDQLRLAQQVNELRNQISYLEQEYHRNLIDELHNHKINKADAHARMQGLEDQLIRAKIYSPETGKIVGLDLVTVGQVVDAGREIMQIVPQDQTYRFIAKIFPEDVDQIMAGQQVEIKFSSFNSNFMPVLYGVVDILGADVKFDNMTQMSYYEVDIKINQDVFDELDKLNWQLRY